jgi:hypothetical protein
MKRKQQEYLIIAIIVVLLLIIFILWFYSGTTIETQLNVKEECMRMNCQYTTDGKCVCY